MWAVQLARNGNIEVKGVKATGLVIGCDRFLVGVLPNTSVANLQRENQSSGHLSNDSEADIRPWTQFGIMPQSFYFSFQEGE